MPLLCCRSCLCVLRKNGRGKRERADDAEMCWALAYTRLAGPVVKMVCGVVIRFVPVLSRILSMTDECYFNERITHTHIVTTKLRGGRTLACTRLSARTSDTAHHHQRATPPLSPPQPLSLSAFTSSPPSHENPARLGTSTRRIVNRSNRPAPRGHSTSPSRYRGSTNPPQQGPHVPPLSP